MKRLGFCTVNKFSGHGNRIPEEAVEGYIFRGTKDSRFQAWSDSVSVRWGETLTQEKGLVPSLSWEKTCLLVWDQMRLSPWGMKSVEGGKIKQ